MALPRSSPCAGGPTHPYNPHARTIFTDTSTRISAWPSRGGVIILDDAEAIDCDFLGLNPLDPLRQRLNNQADEDNFCQRLLLLGAKWWDSEARWSIVSAIEGGATPEQRVDDAFKIGKQRLPTMREKRIVKVGWPSSGGVWIAEFDTTWAGVDEEDKLLPEDAEIGQLRMARTMDERCRLLQRWFKAQFFEDLKEYDGYGFMNSWKSKQMGEVGKLLQPEETAGLWREAYYSTSS